jgi:hypothetical protein
MYHSSPLKQIQLKNHPNPLEKMRFAESRFESDHQCLVVPRQMMRDLLPFPSTHRMISEATVTSTFFSVWPVGWIVALSALASKNIDLLHANQSWFR